MGKIYLTNMIKIEQKKIKNKGFYYLSEQVNIGNKFKKIQVYLGKNIPKNLGSYLESLKNKEIDLISENITNLFTNKIDLSLYREIEKTRINFKYYFWALSKKEADTFWRNFAIRFIFESNRIEGSRLSQDEIKNIVNNKYIKKNTERKEILEVENSIKAFNRIRNNGFKLNQNNIKQLHKIVVGGLDVELGYKKKKIVVNNKETCSPEKVKEEMVQLIGWWKRCKKMKGNQFLFAIKFHQRFEKIHPFSDGNGRVGRLVLIWMLKEFGYGVVLFKDKNKQRYFNALDSADEGRNNKLYKYSVDVYKETFKNIRNL